MKRLITFLFSAVLLASMAVPVAASTADVPPTSCNQSHPENWDPQYIGYLALWDGNGPDEYVCIRGFWSDTTFDGDVSHANVDVSNVLDFDSIKNQADVMELVVVEDSMTNYSNCRVNWKVFDGWGQTLDNWSSAYGIAQVTDNNFHQTLYYGLPDNANQSSRLRVDCGAEG